MLKRYPLSEFLDDSEAFIVMLKESQQPIVLTIDGEDSVVVQDAIAFQEILDRLTAAEEELEYMDLERLRREAEIGRKDLSEGHFTSYNADKIGSLADRIKAEGRSEAFQELLDELKVVQEKINAVKLESLRRDIQVGIDQIEAGEYTEYTEETLNELFEEIMREGRRELGLAA